VAAYRITIRRRGTTQRERHATLEAAVRALEERLDAVALAGRRGPEHALARTYEPVHLVAARGELKGPGRIRGGVDLRGDGSTEAYTGRWRKQLVDRRAGETAYDALRRAVGRRGAS
jgi:hypothetical protein